MHVLLSCTGALVRSEVVPSLSASLCVCWFVCVCACVSFGHFSSLFISPVIVHSCRSVAPVILSSSLESFLSQ